MYLKLKSVIGLLVIGQVYFLLPVFAYADEVKKNNILSQFQGAPKYKDAKGNWFKLRGRLFYDMAWLNETASNGAVRTINADEFRAARIGVQGKVGSFNLVAELDFAGGKTSFKDVSIAWNGPVTVKMGQLKTTNSMEETTSSRNISFLERAMITDGFGLDRRLGVILAKTGENYGITAGIFGNSIDAKRNNLPSNTVFSARASFAPILENDEILHLGASVRFTDNAVGAPKRSARWGPHLALKKIKPIIGDNAVLYGLEAAYVLGPFHGQAEFMAEDGDLGSAKGGFIQAGYFLTKETRKYKAGAGKFDRTKPFHPLSQGGFGGWEVLARYDTFDAIYAGDEKVDAWTVGLTWYLESHLRVKLNYTEANSDRFVGDGLQLRFQVDW